MAKRNPWQSREGAVLSMHLFLAASVLEYLDADNGTKCDMIGQVLMQGRREL